MRRVIVWSSNRTPSSISITFLNLNFVYVYVIGAAVQGVAAQKEKENDSSVTVRDGCIRINNFFIFLGQQVLKKIKEEGYINCTLVQVRGASKAR